MKKLEILQKIAEGKLKANELPKAIKERNYILEHTGLYKCIETGECYTYEEVNSINQKIPINHWFFFIHEEKNSEGRVVTIKQSEIKTSDLLEEFGPDEFLTIMKSATVK